LARDSKPIFFLYLYPVIRIGHILSNDKPIERSPDLEGAARVGGD
jgi:hypothetical protein